MLIVFLISLITCSMNLETAVTFTCCHFSSFCSEESELAPQDQVI